MNTRSVVELTLLSLAALTFVGACHAREEANQAWAVAEVSKAKADSLGQVVAQQTDQMERIDAEATRRIAEATRERDEAVTRADSAAQERPAAVSGVIAAWGDSVAVRDAVRALERVHVAEVSALRSALASADSVSADLRRQIQTRDRVIGGLRAQVAELDDAVDFYRRAARPSWLDRAGTVLVGAAFGVVAWEVVR